MRGIIGYIINAVEFKPTMTWGYYWIQLTAGDFSRSFPGTHLAPKLKTRHEEAKAMAERQ
jgi:hypothetical protein